MFQKLIPKGDAMKRMNSAERKAQRKLRRKYRVGFLKMILTVGELKKAGVLTPGMDHTDAAELVAECLGDNNDTVSDLVGVDWDKLIELILKLLPLILALFGL